MGGTFLINGSHAMILFDLGAIHSFIASDFILEVGLVSEKGIGSIGDLYTYWEIDRSRHLLSWGSGKLKWTKLHG